MNDIRMLIGGERCATTSGATFERRNPLDGQVATRAPGCPPEDAVQAVEAAAKAFPAWSAMGPGERRGLLLKVLFFASAYIWFCPMMLSMRRARSCGDALPSAASRRSVLARWNLRPCS